jgi:Phosphofructokinase
MKIAILTGGGVAPGMNAAVRAVAQAAFSRGWEVVEAENAYDGLLEGRLQPVDRSRLGTFLCTGARPCSLRGAPRRSGSPKDSSASSGGSRKPVYRVRSSSAAGEPHQRQGYVRCRGQGGGCA